LNNIEYNKSNSKKMDKLKEYVDAIDVPIALKNFSNDI
jgi:hypothetical protein